MSKIASLGAFNQAGCEHVNLIMERGRGGSESGDEFRWIVWYYFIWCMINFLQHAVSQKKNTN